MRQISAMEIKQDCLIDVGTCFQSERFKRLIKVPAINNKIFQNLLNGFYLAIKEENCIFFLNL